uniref:Uncharacterized protein n=1 Tax=Anguilla anguilla TaxID=7936 RepID=A0A0E9S9Y7_ANGAN
MMLFLSKTKQIKAYSKNGVCSAFEV